MTTKLSFACMHSEHWACPSHVAVFHCECRCHQDTIAAEHEATDDKPAKRTNTNGQGTPEPA